MKKFFGWFFIVTGVFNFIRAFAMISDGATQSGSQSTGGVISFAIGFIGLGIWMVNSAGKNKADNNSDGFDNRN